MVSVCLVAPYCYQNDAIGIYMHALAKQLSRFYSVQIVALHGDYVYGHNCKVHLTYLSKWPAGSVPSLFSDLRPLMDVAAVREADIVFQQWVAANSLFLYALRRTLRGKITVLDYQGTTPVAYVRGLRAISANLISDPLLRAVHHQYSRVLVHSRFIQQHLERTLKKAADVIPLGVDVKLFAPRRRSEEKLREVYGFSDKEQLIIYVGRIAKHKRVDFIVRALAVLRQKTTLQPRLLVVGAAMKMNDEVIFRSINRVSSGLNVKDYVTFLDNVGRTAIPGLYRMADVFVTASLHEGFCLPLIEAMASGTPVIGSRCGSIPEVIGDAGITFDPLDVRDLAACIQRVLTDSSVAKRLKEAGLRRAQEFSWEKIGEKLRAYIDGLMNA